jgi:phage terminase small subunit
MARLPNQHLKPGAPVKPKSLSKSASLEWDRLLEDFTESGVQLSKSHSELLAMAATTAADMADARETVETEGAYIENEKTGVTQLHPAARRLDNLRRDYIKVLSLLGLRSAVGGDTGAKADSLRGILGG